MKILFLSSLYPPNVRGGGEISTHIIAKNLVALGHEVTVITSGEQKESYELEGVTVLRFPVPLTGKPLFERSHAKRIARVLKKEVSGYDIVHAHDFRTAQVISEIGITNAIVTARDYAQICGSPNNLLSDGSQCNGCNKITNVMRNMAVKEASLLRKPFRIWQYRYNIKYRLSSFRKFKHQIFISNAQLRQIKKVQDLSNTKTYVVYNPIDDKYINDLPKRAVENNILFVGTVQSYKGVGILLEAFKRLAKEEAEIHLNIVGDGVQRKKYELLVEAWGLQYRITFKGRIANNRLLRIYDESRVVVAPHIWLEPFGRTVVEAMSREKLVVAADIGGPSETIQNDKTGILFEAGSVDDLYVKLKKAVKMGELNQRQIGVAARRWVQQNLSGETIAKRHLDIYQQIL